MQKFNAKNYQKATIYLSLNNLLLFLHGKHYENFS